MKKIALFTSLCLSVGLLYGCGSDKEKEKPVEPKKEEIKVEKEEKEKQDETKDVSKETVSNPQKQYIYNDEDHALRISWTEDKGVLTTVLQSTAIRTIDGKKESSRQQAKLTGTIQPNGQIVFKTLLDEEIKGKIEGNVLKLELPNKKDNTKMEWFTFKPGTVAEYEEIVEVLTK